MVPQEQLARRLKAKLVTFPEVSDITIFWTPHTLISLRREKLHPLAQISSEIIEKVKGSKIKLSNLKPMLHQSQTKRPQ